MSIAYFADPHCNHGHKWISRLAGNKEVLLFCTQQENHFPLYAQQPNVHIYPILPREFSLRNTEAKKEAIQKVRELIYIHQARIAHAMYAVPYALWAAEAGLPYLVTTRGSDMLVDYNQKLRQPKNFRQRISFPLLRRAIEKALKNARYVTSTSLQQIKVIKTFHPDPSRLFLTRTGVEAEKFLAQYAALPAPHKNPGDLIIFSNRAMSALYNIDRIMEATALLREKMPGKRIRLITLNYYSDPAYLEKIKAQIRDQQLEQLVEILGEQTQEQLLSLYKKADLVVMFPSSDGTPVSGIEAMLAGKPLIISPLAYDEDLFNPGTCWKAAGWEAKQVAQIMADVLTLPPAKLEQQTRAAHDAALALANFNTEILKTQRLCEEMLGTPL